MAETVTDNISSAPPPYSPSFEGSVPGGKSDPLKVLERKQEQYPTASYPRQCDFPSVINSSTPISAQPIIMPMMVPQPTVSPYPPCPAMSEKPVSIVVNTNTAGGDDRIACDYRICNFCKRGIMEKKKDWFRITGILVASVLCPPISFLCCLLVCTHVIYLYECSVCRRISKKCHKTF